MDTNALLDKIHEGAYCRVVIRPTVFTAKRLTKRQCEELIRTCSVRLRGWPYPWDHESDIGYTEDGVECGKEGPFSIEYWRFFQSGQFVHHFTNDALPAIGKYIDSLDVVYVATEVYLFASRLAHHGVITEGGTILLELNNVAGRRLGFGPGSGRSYSVAQISQLAKIASPQTIDQLALLSDPAGKALDTVEEIFGQFNLRTFDKRLFAEEQRKLLERMPHLVGAPS